MPGFRLKSIALQDLKDIVQRIAAENPSAARVLRNALYEKFQVLAQHPRIAPQLAKFTPDVRCMPHGNYLIFYHPDQDGITVLRVLHGARRITPGMMGLKTDED